MTYQKIIKFLNENFNGWSSTKKAFIATLIEKVIKSNSADKLEENTEVEEIKPGLLYHKSSDSYAKYEGYLISGMLSYKEKIDKLYNSIERRKRK